MDVVERVARQIAQELGDDLDHAFASKSEWIKARGESGGRFRDVNEPRRDDYLDAARAAIAALFDWLEDLPPEVKNEAAKASQAQWGIGHTRYRDMITAARVAALNDVGPAYG